MDNKELQKLTEDISETYFKKPFRHQALFNDRLKTTGGRYLLTSHNIELNRKYLIEHGREELIGIIKHELCHYHLHLEEKGTSTETEIFECCCGRSTRQGSVHPLRKNRKQKTYMYICTACGQQYIKKRAMNPDRYRCGKCRGKIKEFFVKRLTNMASLCYIIKVVTRDK